MGAFGVANDWKEKKGVTEHGSILWNMYDVTSRTRTNVFTNSAPGSFVYSCMVQIKIWV